MVATIFPSSHAPYRNSSQEMKFYLRRDQISELISISNQQVNSTYRRTIGVSFQLLVNPYPPHVRLEVADRIQKRCIVDLFAENWRDGRLNRTIQSACLA